MCAMNRIKTRLAYKIWISGLPKNLIPQGILSHAKFARNLFHRILRRNDGPHRHGQQPDGQRFRRGGCGSGTGNEIRS